MSPSDVRTVVTKYVKSRELVSTENKRYVSLFQQFIFCLKRFPGAQSVSSRILFSLNRANTVIFSTKDEQKSRVQFALFLLPVFSGLRSF